MITFRESDRTFYLDTAATTYLMMIDEQGHLEHVHYGAKIDVVDTIDDLRLIYHFEHGSATSYDKQSKGVMLHQKRLELSTYGKGDYREPLLHLELPSGSRTVDFVYESHTIVTDLRFPGMPQADKSETLVITLKDTVLDIRVRLHYTVFEEANAIVRNLVVINDTDQPLTLDRALSFQLDLPNRDYVLSKLDGAWIRERHIEDVDLTYGTVRFDSKKGVSSADHNPFFVLKERRTTDDYGIAYGFALIYSGSFEAFAETQTHDLVRVAMGVNSFDFRYVLKAGASFVTPEVILSVSDRGLNRLSNQFHDIINHHVVDPAFRNKERPIVINNWEATYFDFNEKKLLAIAKQAADLGMELFCLDDGWFAKRDDDTASLGDWYYNKKKLPRGLAGIGRKLNKLGLAFGLWVEPEMVNEDSDLYREHPDWAIRVPGREPSLGRNQLILDLANPDVRTYLKTTLTSLFQSAPVSYVKWDMNRNFSDVFSHHLSSQRQGAFHYLYAMGLYEVLEHLKTTCPDILFENCASGGNRFDLGMLHYMPQTWTSDNTDAFERLLIQEGTSLCYPLSTISNHVSGDRSHQTFRHTPLETRFNVACFGVLGYELDLTTLTPFDKKTIARQIAFYKQHRRLFQFGRFRRLASVRAGNETVWMVTSDDHQTAIVGYFQKQAQPNPGFRILTIDELAMGTYHITNRPQYINVRTFGSLVNEALPIKLKVNHTLHNLVANRYLYESEQIDRTLTDDQLQHAGLVLPHRFTGTGHGDNDMILTDYDSRLYIITKENQHEH